MKRGFILNLLAFGALAILWIAIIYGLEHIIRINSIKSIQLTFIHWAMIAISYYITYHLVKRYLPEEDTASIVLGIVYGITSAVSFAVIAMVIHTLFLTATPCIDDTITYTEKFGYTDIAIPMMIGASFAVMTAIRSHNKTIL
uniref:hypothetical protein n=1 Tax=Pedobacter schmidteae TaxID=2201271 RepID=UPI000EACE9AC|nr:hypothetical protein [Pedobacter schmidteae]